MKLSEYELSRAIRFFDIKPRSGQVLYGANLVKAVQDRYGFVEIPRTIAEYNLEKGVTFLHGYFDHRIVIEKFQIYNNGLMVEAKGDTDVCDAFLDDVFGWAEEAAGITLAPKPELGTPYLSQIVIESDVELGQYFSGLRQFAARISAKVASYGLVDAPAEVAAFHLTTDPALNGGWTYKLERRSGVPFEKKLFFSSAPLRTSDHLNMLGSLEAALSPAANA